MLDRIIAKLFPCVDWGHWFRKGEQVAGHAIKAGTDNPVHWVTCRKCGYLSMRIYTTKKGS